MFWGNFWSNFLSNLIADGVIIGSVLFILERHFSRKDEERKETEKEKRRKENLRIAVNMLWSEIEYNRGQLNLLIENLSQRPRPNLIYPALDTSYWEVIDHQQLIDGLKPESTADLLKIYNRVYTINKMYYQMLDKVEWILLGTDSTVRREFIDQIIFRSKELLDFIAGVIPQKPSSGKA